MGASGGFPIDLVLFGMIAAFLVLRLRSILGKRTGFERPAPPIQPVPLRPPSGRSSRPRPNRSQPAAAQTVPDVGVADRAGAGADAGDSTRLSIRPGSWPGRIRRSG